MGFTYNPFTGQLDKVKVPLANSTVSPTQSVNGDIQLAQVSNEGRIYFRVGNQDYYVGGVSISNPTVIPPSVILFTGQPIPIGMGLTFTYS